MSCWQQSVKVTCNCHCELMRVDRVKFQKSRNSFWLTNFLCTWWKDLTIDSMLYFWFDLRLNRPHLSATIVHCAYIGERNYHGVISLASISEMALCSAQFVGSGVNETKLFYERSQRGIPSLHYYAEILFFALLFSFIFVRSRSAKHVPWRTERQWCINVKIVHCTYLLLTTSYLGISY